MSQWHEPGCVGQVSEILQNALVYIIRYADTTSALAELVRQLTAFVVIKIQYQ